MATQTNTTAPEWFKNSEKNYAKLYANAPAVTGNGSSGGGSSSGNSGRNVYIGNQAYGYDTARIRSADELSALVGGYNYDESAIRSLFDKATKAEYAAKRAAIPGAQRQFASNTGEYINTLSDTMRQQLNQAVATGGSRGLAAAQAMQAAQDASLKTVDEATKLTEDAMALDFEEAAAYTQNAKDAEALRATRQQNLMNIMSGLYDIDERTTVGAMSAAADAWGSRLYGLDAAKENYRGTVYNADKNAATEELIARIQSDDNMKQFLTSMINSGALVPDDSIAQLFGITPGLLRNPPQNSSGSYYNSGSGSGNPLERNIADTQAATKLFNQFLMSQDRAGAIGALGSVSGYDSAVTTYDDAKKTIYDNANKMTFDEFKAFIKYAYNGSEADAKKFYESYSGKSATVNRRVENGGKAH